jgi:DNA polymerase III alpha subunit
MSSDIDIDFGNRDIALAGLQHIVASIKNPNGKFKKHNTGVYFQDIPVNPLTNLSSIDYKEADKRGYFKIDFLNVNIYQDIKDNNHLLELMNKEPIWELLEQDDFVNLLFHINGYGNILRKMKPKSLEQLAAILAMIRPGKKHLIGKDWNTVLKEAWISNNDSNGYAFKRSHSFAYAMAIIVQMNLIIEQATTTS